MTIIRDVKQTWTTLMSQRAQQKTATRARILDAAARAVRLNGPDRVSVTAVMKEAGLTHGTFYAHFASKDDLVAAAVEHAGESFRQALAAAADQVRPGGGAIGLASAYLTLDHVADPGAGCPIAALGPELARAGRPVSGALRTAVERAVDLIEARSPPGSAARRRQRSIASLAAVVGAVVLARAAPDEAGAQEILDACRSMLTDRSSSAEERAP